MKKLFTLLLAVALMLPIITFAGGDKATVFNPITGDRKVVKVGDPNAFVGGYMLETSFGYVPVEDNKLGFSVTSGFDKRLSKSMTSVQNTIDVTSMTTKEGVTLTMAMLGSKVFLTIEPGRSKEEIAMCTGISGNQFTGCTRGLAFYGTSTASVAGNRKTHSAGSRIIMSNVHYVYEELVDKDTNQTIAGNLTIHGNLTATGTVTFTNLPVATSTDPTQDNELVPKKYVDDTVSAGAPDGTESVKGINELATQEEMSSGTAQGSTATNLVLQSQYASSTPNGITIPVTEEDGDLNADFIGQDQDYTWSGNNTHSGTNIFYATTTLATTTIEGFNPISVLDGSTTTLHNHNILSTITGLQIVVSDVLMASADTERATSVTSYVKVKEIVAPFAGTYRIKFGLKVQGGTGTAYGRIYKNGVAYGTEQSEAGTSYVTYSEDLSFSKGDLIQLYIKHSTGADTAKINNFRIYGSMLPVITVNTD